MTGYQNKFKEAEYNLTKLKQSFALGSLDFEHDLNNFLSSVQSIFWTLNKSFDKSNGYTSWKEARGKRLPEDAKTFKELRNVSLKEEPIKHEGIIVDFDFGAKGIFIPPNATVATPWFNTEERKLVSTKATITTIDGKSYEVEPLIIHDFTVALTTNNKDFKIDYFISKAQNYLLAIHKEIIATEQKFK